MARQEPKLTSPLLEKNMYKEGKTKVTKVNYQELSNKQYTFPANTIIGLMHIEGYPEALTDGYIIELHASETDLKGGTKNKPMLKSILDEKLKLIESSPPLSQPQYLVSEGGESNFDYFILFNSKYNNVGVQTKYYNYFINKYPGCNFRQADELDPIIICKLPSELSTIDNIIGLIMPVIPHSNLEVEDD